MLYYGQSIALATSAVPHVTQWHVNRSVGTLGIFFSLSLFFWSVFQSQKDSFNIIITVALIV